jgi:hypothetical protein
LVYWLSLLHGSLSLRRTDKNRGQAKYYYAFILLDLRDKINFKRKKRQ